MDDQWPTHQIDKNDDQTIDVVGNLKSKEAIKEVNKKIKQLENEINSHLSSFDVSFDFGENGDFQRLLATIRKFGKTFANETFVACSDKSSPSMIFRYLEVAEISSAKKSNEFGIEKTQYYYVSNYTNGMSNSFQKVITRYFKISQKEYEYRRIAIRQSKENVIW